MSEVKKPYEFSKEWCLRSAEIEGDAEIGAGSLSGFPAVTRDELIELLTLMDAADSALDKDTYDQSLRDEFDAPDDADYSVCAGTVRKCSAVFAAIEKLRNRVALPSPTQTKGAA